jgi:hypothetical protein
MILLQGEYIFDHRGGEVEGRTFREWFINEYMITNETLFHKDPKTGAPQPIGLGWLDDRMDLGGPSEESPYYISDTGASGADMAEQVAAYQESIAMLTQKVVPMGGFWWQLMDTGGNKLAGLIGKQNVARCKTVLSSLCVSNPPTWARMQMYNVGRGGAGITPEGFTDYTAEFLLTRGPYAMLGYSWSGCTDGAQMRPRAKEWDEDFGEPVGGGAACKENVSGSGVYSREWATATVQWDCSTGRGSITRK